MRHDGLAGAAFYPYYKSLHQCYKPPSCLDLSPFNLIVSPFHPYYRPLSSLQHAPFILSIRPFHPCYQPLSFLLYPPLHPYYKPLSSFLEAPVSLLEALHPTGTCLHKFCSEAVKSALRCQTTDSCRTTYSRVYIYSTSLILLCFGPASALSLEKALHSRKM